MLCIIISSSYSISVNMKQVTSKACKLIDIIIVLEIILILGILLLGLSVY